MRGQPIGVAAAGAMAGDVDEVLHGEPQAVERPVAGRRQREPFDELPPDCSAVIVGMVTSTILHVSTSQSSLWDDRFNCRAN